jgi:RimJ/RimL family protein N-acetyltransferase
MKIIETDRLLLRWLTTEDAPFILQLLNDPSWIQFIGDKGVKSLEDARNYLLTGPMDMYDRLGFGLYLVHHKRENLPIGICGLIKREYLKDVDLGFAFLSKYQSNGYGYEAAQATIDYGTKKLGLKRILAFTSKDNDASSKLLEKVGLTFEKMVVFPNNPEELKLFKADY